MACEEIRQKILTLKQHLEKLQHPDTEDEIGIEDVDTTGMTPQQAARARAEAIFAFKRRQAQRAGDIRNTQSLISATQVELEICLRKSAGVFVAPKEILEIRQINPDVDRSSDDWAVKIAGGMFPEHSGFEWKQVLAPDEEYDDDVVGMTGWVINPSLTKTDFPFSHPFGFDWEFECALDSQYDSLLAPGNAKTIDNTSENPEIARAKGLNIPVPVNGLLGVEMDNAFVPQDFQKEVHEGNRIAVYGRWIVDCGHENFHTEIHPPLLMANASPILQTNTDHGTGLGTRVVFTSRPYLVSQKYTNDLSKIDDDDAEDDGTFYDHLIKEIGRVIGVVGIPLSLLVEAHAKNKHRPFRGVHLMHFVVRPTSSPSSPLANMQLAISYHFTIRNGCAIQVISSSPDSVEVFVVMNSVNYTPPPLPARISKRYSRDELEGLHEGAGDDYLNVEALASALGAIGITGPLGSLRVAATLERGIETHEFSALANPNFHDINNAVIDTPVNNISHDKGITVDDAQPFPITGWLELKWIPVMLQTNSGIGSVGLGKTAPPVQP